MDRQTAQDYVEDLLAERADLYDKLRRLDDEIRDLQGQLYKLLKELDKRDN